MAFDGNGNWISNFSAVADRDANIKILASRFDDIFIADIAQSFENCLTKDAQVKPQQAFDANSYKVINVANPTNDYDAVNLQTVESTFSTKVPASVGSGKNPVYTDNNGVITSSNETVGDDSKPVYLNNGEIKSFSKSIYEMIIPDYSNPVTLTSGWAATKSGIAFFRFGGQGTWNVSINGVNVINYNWGANYGSPDNANLIIGKGDVVVFNGGLIGFYPFKGQ